MGRFQWNLTFGPGEANETTLYTSAYDAGLTNWKTFVAKYNPDGTLAWAKKPATGYSSALPLSDGVLVPGYSGEVAKLNADGTLAWKRVAATLPRHGHVSDAAVLPDGGYALLGHFGGTVTFPQGPGVTFESMADGPDIFLARFYDPSVIPPAPWGPAPPPPPPPAGPEFVSEEFHVTSDGWSGLYAYSYATGQDCWTGGVFGGYTFPTALPMGQWVVLCIYDLEAGTWEEGIYLYKEEWD